MKRLVVATGSRAEWGHLRQFARLARRSGAFEFKVVAAGMHFSEVHGSTYREIEADGFDIAEAVVMLNEEGLRSSPAWSLTHGVGRFTAVLDRMQPDLVLVEGDRVEPLAAALACQEMGIPLCHSGGGDLTRTLDDVRRKQISMMASIHFVSTADGRDRLIRYGCDPLAIHVTGALGVDAIMAHQFRSREETLVDLGLLEGSRYLLVGFHPESEHVESAGQWADNLIRACLDTGRMVVATYPNSDLGSRDIILAINGLAEDYEPRMRVFASLGHDRYLDALKHADALVGNSSSGLYEAPSLRVPVVNVGHRQEGRLKAANVLDSGYDYQEIADTLEIALHGRLFRAGVGLAENPYGDGNAAERMLAVIEGRLSHE